MSKARDLASGQNGVRPFATSSGLSASIASSGTITFPVGRFTVAPNVVGMLLSSTSGGTSVATGAVTTSSFSAYVWSGTTAATRQVYWIATQMTSTTAGG
jgi:hypothetical protein